MIGSAPALGGAMVLTSLLAYYAHAWAVRRGAWAARIRPLVRLRPGLLLAGALLAGDALGGLAWWGLIWGLWRQWAWPPMAGEAQPWRGTLRPDDVLILLPDGSAVPRGWLWRRRVLRRGGLLLVGCSIARSVRAFRWPGPVRVTLPLAVGFEIAGSGRWHGVTGEALDGGQPLRPVPVRVVVAEGFGGAVFGGPPRRGRRSVLPGTADARDGVVEGGRWREGDGQGWFVAAWAASELGLR